MRLNAAVLVQLILLGHAHGYCPRRFVDAEPEVQKTVWPESGTAVRVAFSDTLDTEKLQAIKAAFESWAAVECSTLAFEYLDETEQLFKLSEVSYSAPSATLAEIYIFWIDGSAEPPDFVGGFENVIGHTYARHDRNGKLTTASIAFNDNSDDYPWRVLTENNDSFFDVQTVAMKQIGQVIGLTESDLTTGTVMTKGSILTGRPQPAPVPLEDDEDALQYLYWDDTCTEQQRPPDPGAEQYCYPPPTADASLSDGAAARDGGIDGDGSSLDGGMDASAGCDANAQCGTGQVCTVEGECVSVGDDDGCSCSTSVDPARGALGLLALFGLALLLRRRP